MTEGEKEADDIEMDAAYASYRAGLGVGEWESFLTRKQTERLIELAELGFGTWAKEPHTLEMMKASHIRKEHGINEEP